MRDPLPGDVLDNIIPEVRALGAYTLKATEARVKLNQNEAPFDIPAAVKARILERTAARPWNRYPDFHPADVLDGLGHHHGLEGRNVLLGNGSNELIQAILAACVGPDTTVVLPSPTFTLYEMMVRANQGNVRTIPLQSDLSYDIPAWEDAADRNDAHLLLCTPNNPTGSTVHSSTIDSLCSRTRRLVIVDEAYGQFGDGTHDHLLQRHPNLVILRTFSKALGLAAVRLGYALAHADLASQINKVKLPYNVGIFGLEVARVALDEPALMDGWAQQLRTAREDLRNSLASIPGLQVFPGLANFVLVRTPHAAPLFDALLQRGILVRDVGRYPMLAHCLRISIGTDDENRELLSATRQIMTALHNPSEDQA